MRIGIFGGTFDPPHVGHLILAEEAIYQLRLQKVLFILTPFPPHKEGQFISPLSQRLTLLQAAIRENPFFRLSRVDINRQPPHYAADTVALLAKRNHQASLVYLMGGDSLHDLPGWHTPERFLAGCAALGILRRPGDQVDMALLEAQFPGITAMIEWIEAPLLEIASSEIRQRIQEGGS